MITIHSGEEILPVFLTGNSVVCVFEISEQYIPYFDVFLKSFQATMSDSHNYDIIVLSSDICSASEAMLVNQYGGKDNVSIRFYNPQMMIQDAMDENRNKYLNLNYYRLALPWILTNYDKALNFGVDMVILRDIAALFNTGLENDVYVAGVRDLDYVGRLQIDIPSSELGLSRPEDYINADVLLLNLKQIRENFQMHDILTLWSRYKFRLAEQDVINSIFENHILFLDGRWNVFPKGMLSDDRIVKAPREYQEEWERNLLDPYIIHFAGTPKPWDNPEIGYASHWWRYAMESCFYARFIYNMVQRMLGQKKPALNKLIDWLLPPGSGRGSQIKETALWQKLRRFYHILTRDPDMEKFGKQKRV